MVPPSHSYTVCLVGEPREQSGADPHFGDGSNPSRVWFVWLKERDMEWMAVFTPLVGPTCHWV
jgi:hypothetical protein